MISNMHLPHTHTHTHTHTHARCTSSPMHLPHRGYSGIVLGLISILWSTYSATRFFEAGLQMQASRYLIAYPALLLYACFALITVF